MNLTNLTLITSSIPWPTLQTPYSYLNTWCPLALVVTEIALRWQLTQDVPGVLNPHELRAERYQELVQGLALLSVATCALYWKSGVLLASITVAALGRLYGDLKIVPWVKGLTEQEGAVQWTAPNRTYFDTMYALLEGACVINLFFHTMLLNIRHPVQGLLAGTTTLVLPALISKIFRRMVDTDYWGLPNSRLTSLKIERMQTLMHSLLGIRLAFVHGLLALLAAGIHLALNTLLKRETPFFIALIPSLVMGGYHWGSFHSRFNSFLQRWVVGISCAGLAADISNDTAQRVMFKVGYFLSVWGIPDDLVEDLIEDFNSNTLDKINIQRIFYLIHETLRTDRIVKILDACTCFTPDFLSTREYLWQCFNNDQIQTYLLIPEIKQLLQEDKVVKTETELQKLAESVSEAEKANEKSFSALRPLREWIEELSFTKANEFLLRVPSNEKPIVIALNSLKPKIQEREKAIAALEQRLEILCEDMTPAYEGIPHLRENDTKKVLELAGISVEGQHGTVLFNLLAILGIKWKGDLVVHKILQSGDGANSNELLIERLVKFIQEHNV